MSEVKRRIYARLSPASAPSKNASLPRDPRRCSQYNGENMANVAELKPGQVNIKGKVYSTVALRVQTFREKHPEYSLETEIVCRDIEVVAMKALIRDPSGRILATGHAEEYRSTSSINATSALENAETSAIGRALAALGLGGTEFASADEVARAVSGAKPPAPAASGQGVKEAALAGLTAARRNVVMDTAVQVQDKLNEGSDFDAYALCESITDADEKVALWGLLASGHRSRLKAAAQAEKQRGAAEWKKEVGATA
jgi:hypothetical protein